MPEDHLQKRQRVLHAGFCFCPSFPLLSTIMLSFIPGPNCELKLSPTPSFPSPPKCLEEYPNLQLWPLPWAHDLPFHQLTMLLISDTPLTVKFNSLLQLHPLLCPSSPCDRKLTCRGLPIPLSVKICPPHLPPSSTWLFCPLLKLGFPQTPVQVHIF